MNVCNALTSQSFTKLNDLLNFNVSINLIPVLPLENPKKSFLAQMLKEEEISQEIRCPEDCELFTYSYHKQSRSISRIPMLFDSEKKSSTTHFEEESNQVNIDVHMVSIPTKGPIERLLFKKTNKEVKKFSILKVGI